MSDTQRQQAIDAMAPGRPPSSHRLASEECYRSLAGTICKGMEVVDAEGKLLGHVDAVEGELIWLASPDAKQVVREFLPLSLIAGITDTRVLLAGRGDASFGLEAEE